MLGLAQMPKGRSSASSAELAETMSIPYRFLRKLVHGLVEAKLVNSTRGKNGGLALARPADEISLLDVLRAVDPRVVQLNSCLAGRNVCPRDSECPVHRQLEQLQVVLDQALAAVTFDTLT